MIELLVVIAVIGLLASVVLVSVGGVRAKARDAKKQETFRAISTALYLFHDKTGRMPNNYRHGYGVCEGDGFYEQSMQELINAGILFTIPKSPGGHRYCYYNYGSGNSIGALMVTFLEAAPDTTTGIPPSCRPFAAGTNWCSRSSDKHYCICHPH